MKANAQLRPIKVTRGSAEDVSEQWGASPLSQAFQAKLQDDDADLIIYAIIDVAGSVSAERLRQAIREKILPLRRFSSIMEYEGGRYRWKAQKVLAEDIVKEVEDFQETAMDYACRLFTQPMDLTQRLWEVYILRKATEKGDTLLFRIHHSLGDGISLASLFLDLIETTDGEELKLPSPRKVETGSFLGAAARAFSYAWNTLCFVARLTLLLLVADPANPAKPKKSVRHLPREVSGFSVPLAEVKAIGAAVRATVNDVLLAVLAAAVHKFTRAEKRKILLERMDAKGPEPTKEEEAKLRELESFERIWRPHALIIVNLRQPLTKDEIEGMRKGIESRKWGTVVGYVVGRLPVNRVSSPLDRLAKVKGVMDRAKMSFEPIVSNFIMLVLSTLLGPTRLLRFLTYVTTQATLALSNFPGPQTEVSFIGNKVLSMYQFVSGSPQGISFHGISYNGNLYVSVTTHASSVGAREMCEYALEALGDLKEEVGWVPRKRVK